MSSGINLISFELSLINFNDLQRKKIKITAKDKASAIDKVNRLFPEWNVEFIDGKPTNVALLRKSQKEKTADKFVKESKRRTLRLNDFDSDEWE
jgi:hypothetical protein